MTCTEKQVKLLMECSKKMTQEAAAAKAAMSVRTARKYMGNGGLMTHKTEWKWRQTHADAFAPVWNVVEEMLARDPGLQG